MVYWAVKCTTPHSKPVTQNSQPIGFWGEMRGTMTAPTGEKPIASRVFTVQYGWTGVCGWDAFRTSSIRLIAVSAKESAHIDQASHAAARRLIPPTPRPCALVPSVMKHLYRTTSSQALPNPLRRRELGDLQKTFLLRRWVHKSEGRVRLYVVVRYSCPFRGGGACPLNIPPPPIFNTPL